MEGQRTNAKDNNISLGARRLSAQAKKRLVFSPAFPTIRTDTRPNVSWGFAHLRSAQTALQAGHTGRHPRRLHLRPHRLRRRLRDDVLPRQDGAVLYNARRRQGLLRRGNLAEVRLLDSLQLLLQLLLRADAIWRNVRRSLARLWHHGLYYVQLLRSTGSSLKAHDSIQFNSIQFNSLEEPLLCMEVGGGVRASSASIDQQSSATQRRLSRRRNPLLRDSLLLRFSEWRRPLGWSTRLVWSLADRDWCSRLLEHRLVALGAVCIGSSALHRLSRLLGAPDFCPPAS